MAIRHPLGTIALALLLTSLLSGCIGQNTVDSPQSSPQKTPVGDPAQARTDLYAQLDEIQELVGGNWTNSDNTTPEECVIDGVSGVTFTGFRLTNDSAGDASLDTVSAVWKEKGFEVTAQNDVGPYKRVIATLPGKPGHVLVFGVAENAMSLTGQGICGEGDLLEWIHKIRDELADTRTK